MTAFIAKLRAWSKKYNTRAVVLTLALSPFLLVVMSEANSTQSYSGALSFLTSHLSVSLFNFIFVSVLLLALSLIFRKLWIPLSLVSLIFYTLSVVEYFKYGTSGTHFVMSDMFMVGNASDIGQFTNMTAKPAMFVNFAVLLLLCVFVAVCGFSFDKKGWTPRMAGFAVAAVLIGAVLIPGLSDKVYTFFGIDTTDADNAFLANEKYKSNSFIANLLESTSESIDMVPHIPENYDEESVSSLLTEGESTDAEPKANIVIVMCESYGDFRVFDELDIPDDIYKGFDGAAALSGAASGKAFSPTFGGYTARSEFELLFGLPSLSLRNPPIPHYLLTEGDVFSNAAYLGTFGYDSAYLHPFSSTFYKRDEYFSRYGFDRLHFADYFDSLDGAEYYRGHISDKCIYNEILNELTEEDAPQYIFATTIQNHQPYGSSEGGEYISGEFDAYLEAIKHSSDSLLEFLSALSTFDEETIVLFVGDHFPYFSNEGNIYTSLLDIDSENCGILFEQNYIIYNNRGGKAELPDETVSFFYLPYILMREAGVPLSTVGATVDAQRAALPVYSANSGVKTVSALLDTLTYDIVIGERYSVK